MGRYCRRENSFKILSDEELEQIHEASLRVLQEQGLIFEDEKSLALLEEAGCPVDKERMIARFPQSVIEKIIKSVPEEFTIEARHPRHNLLFSGKEIYFSNLAIQKIQDYETGEVRVATLEDVARMASIIDALEDYHTCFEVCPGILADKPAEVAPLWIMVETMRHTEKSVVGSPLYGLPRWVIEIANVVGQKVKSGISSSSPLAYGNAACRAVFEFAGAGFPLSVGSGIASGATGPATLAGSLVLQNAEVLGGIALVQLVKPGLGVFYGTAGMPMDMRTGRLAGGSIERGLLTVASAQLADLYGLPVWSPFPKTTAHSGDEQCGFEKAFQLILGTMAGIAYSASGGGVTDGSLICLEQLIIDHEMYGMMGRLLEGIKVNESTLAVEIINSVGHLPGSYLTQRHTKENWRGENYLTDICDRTPRGSWIKEGSPDIYRRAHEKVKVILNDHQPAPLSDEVEKELSNLLKAAEREILAG